VGFLHRLDEDATVEAGYAGVKRKGVTSIAMPRGGRPLVTAK
jgi:hypothetical protein